MSNGLSTYGTTGISMATQAETLAYLIVQAKLEFGDSIVTDADEWLGSELINISRADSDTKLALQHVIDSISIANATGSLLEVLAALIGLYKQEAAYSLATLTLTATDATTVPIYTRYKTLTDVIFETLVELVFSGAGSDTVAARCITVGANNAGPGEITEIVNTRYAISAVTNVAAATPGRLIETDPQFKIRHTIAVATSGKESASEIYEAVARVSGVSATYVFDNDTNTAIGVVPAHTFYIVAIGGTDAGIAAAIANNKTVTISTHGSETVSVYNEITSQAKIIKFGRGGPVPIYVEVDIDTIDGVYPDDGDKQIKDRMVADYANYKTLNSQVIYAEFYKHIYAMPGISAFNSLKIGIVDPPTLLVDIPMTQTEKPTLALADIDFL